MIIGIAGKARSGKDTAADIIRRGYPTFQQFAFATPLKVAVSHAFGIPLSDLYDDDKKEVVNEFWGISPREMAQKFGTESMRDVFREDFWIKRTDKSIVDSGCKDVIITDVRFENEADYVRDNGGFILHIIRPELGVGVVRDHASERGIEHKDGDAIVVNSTNSLDIYAEEIETVIDERLKTQRRNNNG